MKNFSKWIKDYLILTPITTIAYFLIIMTPFIVYPILRMLLVSADFPVFSIFLSFSTFPYLIFLETSKSFKVDLFSLDMIRIFIKYFALIVLMGFVRAIIMKQYYKFLLINKERLLEKNHKTINNSNWIIFSAISYFMLMWISGIIPQNGDFVQAFWLIIKCICLVSIINYTTERFLITTNINKLDNLSEEKIKYMVYTHWINYIILFALPFLLLLPLIRKDKKSLPEIMLTEAKDS